MKIILWVVALIVTCAQMSLAGDPAPISFNLVQVNNYHRPAAADTVVLQGQRVVIDVQNPGAFRSLTPVSYSTPVEKRVVVNVAVSLDGGADRGIQLPWESNMILYTATHEDSFLVTSSRTGCPGTEVRPSVSVAFATPHGWSNPPIRFGPLSDQTVCPLGRGVKLYVSSVGGAAPYVKIAGSDTYSKR